MTECTLGEEEEEEEEERKRKRGKQSEKEGRGKQGGRMRGVCLQREKVCIQLKGKAQKMGGHVLTDNVLNRKMEAALAPMNM